MWLRMFLYRISILVAICGLFSVSAQAEISPEAASSAVGKAVTLELSSGDRLSGEAVDSSAVSITVETREGQREVISLKAVNKVYIAYDGERPAAKSGEDRSEVSNDVERIPPGHHTQPSSANAGTSRTNESAEESANDPARDPDEWISRKEFYLAEAKYESARNLRTFSYTALAAGAGTLLVGSILKWKANQSGCNVSTIEYEGTCHRAQNTVGFAMLGITPVLVGLGTVLSLTSNAKMRRAKMTRQMYRDQRGSAERESAGEMSAEEGGSGDEFAYDGPTYGRPQTSFQLSPTFSRKGGGVQVGVTF